MTQSDFKQRLMATGRVLNVDTKGRKRPPGAPDSDRGHFYVWHGQGECKVVDNLEKAREMRDDYLEDGDYSTITNERNEHVS